MSIATLIQQSVVVFDNTSSVNNQTHDFNDTNCANTIFMACQARDGGSGRLAQKTHKLKIDIIMIHYYKHSIVCKA